MKRCSSLLIILLFPLLALGQVDARLYRFMNHPELLRETGEPSLKKMHNSWYVEAIIGLQGNKEEIVSHGAILRYESSKMVIALLPYNRMREIIKLPSVRYIESMAADRALTDVSIPDIGVPQARQQNSIGGNGVLIGIIDSGIDWRREDFIRQDGTTRIYCILDFGQPGPVYGGTVYTQQVINAALRGGAPLKTMDYTGHGTHVAGIAAGNAANSQHAYGGIASQADLIIVKATTDEQGTTFYSSNQIISLNFVDSVATYLKKPYVVNMSLGGHNGAHDGTSPVERAIKEQFGDHIAGKAIVTVAGNDGDENIHAVANLEGGPVDIELNLEFVPSDKKIQLDAWYEGRNTIEVSLISPTGKTYGPAKAGGDPVERNTTEGDIYIWNSFYEIGSYAYGGINPYNGDRQVFIELAYSGATAPLKGKWLCRFTGRNNIVHAWIAAGQDYAYFGKGAENKYKISIPGTAENAITVGAYTTKNTWTDIDGHNLTINSESIKVGDIASFSSPGPTRDERVKPEVVAPGQIIGSALSQEALPGQQNSIFNSGSQFPNGLILPGKAYALSSGTSMAAPHITGVVALIMEKYPQARATQIRGMLLQSANPVKQGPQWGWGKVDAEMALQANPEEEPVAKFEFYQPFPNPFSESIRLEMDLPIPVGGIPETSVLIFNILGQQVKTVAASQHWSGKRIIFWDGRDDQGMKLANGIYVIQMISGKRKQIRKVTLIHN